MLNSGATNSAETSRETGGDEYWRSKAGLAAPVDEHKGADRRQRALERIGQLDTRRIVAGQLLDALATTPFDAVEQAHCTDKHAAIERDQSNDSETRQSHVVPVFGIEAFRSFFLFSVRVPDERV